MSSNDIYENNIKLLKSKIILSEQKIKKLYPSLYNNILQKTLFLNSDNHSFSERKYCYIHKLKNIPKCEICDQPTSFRKSYGYKKCCSKKCLNIYEKTISHQKNFQTKLIKYNDGNYDGNYNGHEKVYISAEKRLKINAKISNTKNKFSNEKWEEINNKIRKTKFLRYNDKNYNNKEKGIKTKYENNKSLKYTRPNKIYVLYIKEMNIIKIGITSNVKHRIKRIKNESNIIYDIIPILSERINNPWIIETKLHKKYKQFSHPLPFGGGRTEWFDSCILKNVINDVYEELIDLMELSGLS